VTGGQFKGRIVNLPKGRMQGVEKPVKPTLSKVRESVFNILFSYFEDFSSLSFLDMFAGSGIMALEACSRGFSSVYAIEKNPSIYFSVKKMYDQFGPDITKNITLIRGDSLKIINTLSVCNDSAQKTEAEYRKEEKTPQNLIRTGGFDVIYIDPPWDFNYADIIEAAFRKLNKGGFLILEQDKSKQDVNSPGKNPKTCLKDNSDDTPKVNKKAGSNFSCHNSYIIGGCEIQPLKEKIYGRCKLSFIRL